MQPFDREAKKVLIAEDDAWLREVLGFLLADEGLDAVEASSGPETVEVARQQRPDVIVLDVGLPGRSGFEVLADLREDHSTRNTPVMLISGKTNIHESGHAFEAEAVFHKPLDFAEFLDKVREASTLRDSGRPHRIT
jgi:DNA-binding response OmpR family regulator